MATTQDMIDWLRSIHSISLQMLAEGGARLSTWLVAGNAGALVLIFQTLVAGSRCNVSAVAPSLWLFILGLGFAFFGAVGSQLVGTSVTATISDLINSLWLVEKNKSDLEALEAEYGAQSDTPLHASIAEQEVKQKVLLAKMANSQKHAKRMIWLQMTSVVLFGAGIVWPVLSPELISSCAGGS